MSNENTQNAVRHEAYKRLLKKIWSGLKMKAPLHDLDAANIATFLIRHYGSWDLEEIELAFEIGLLPETYTMPEHYGEMTKEYVAEVLRLYYSWKRDIDKRKAEGRARQLADATDTYRVPTDEERAQMKREIVAKAYRNFCNGERVMCLVPHFLYEILVERCRLSADDYKRYMPEAETILKARAMLVNKPNRYHRETSVKDELNSGWGAKKIAMDMAVRAYFDAWKNRVVNEAET